MKINFFKKLFYPPRYLSMKAAGIDINNRSVRYIEFSDSKGNLSIKNFGEVSLLPNIVKNGEIIDKNTLVKALSEVKKKISSDFVKISIPDEKTYIFDTQIPLVKGSNIRESIEFKLEENVPFKVNEVYFEYDTIEKDEKSGIRNMTASISVIPKKIIESFSEVCILAGLSPISFEMESRMVAKSVVPEKENGTFLIIDIKENSARLFLVVSGIVRFTSTVSVGDSAVKENASKTDIFSSINEEIKKFGEYLLSKSEGKGILLPSMIDGIILCGSSAALPDFAGNVSKNTNTKVTLANVWSNIFDINNRLPRVSFENSLDFAAAIGLANS